MENISQNEDAPTDADVTGAQLLVEVLETVGYAVFPDDEEKLRAELAKRGLRITAWAILQAKGGTNAD